MVNNNSPEFFALKETEAASLKNDLQGLFDAFSDDKRKIGELANLLISKYSEKHRAYHNLSHINYLLRDARAFENIFHDYDGVRLAVWFHDAIYEPKSKINEIESAALAVKSLSELNVPKTKIEDVEKMILATQKHDAAALDEDGKLFLDLDLSILGTTPNLYQKYAQAIRREYSFVPETLYREKRREVLQHFLQREFIYYTVEMREFYEEAAQINIANEIEELS